MSSSHGEEDVLLEIAALRVAFGATLAVDGIDLTIGEGERLALVGESGSGKSVTALAILRLLRDAQVDGAIRFAGRDLMGVDERTMRGLRGADIAMVFQEPMTALNPLYTIGEQIVETLKWHETLTNVAATEQAVALLARCGIVEPALRAARYPHQLSGGERQRAVIAMALACRPRLLIADEPTTALDMTIRAQIVSLLLTLQQESKQGARLTAILLITHNLNLVQRFAQRVAVMQYGRIVETGRVEQVFGAPVHAYTRRLLDSRPRREVVALEEGGADKAAVVLQADALTVSFPGPARSWWRRRPRFRALDAVGLQVRRGETLGIVGESGSGKSTLAMALLGLQALDSGRLTFEQQPVPTTGFTKAMRARLQVVFQDPYSALSPRQTVREIVEEGVALHWPALSPTNRLTRVLAVLQEVGLGPEMLSRYPHAFSGGQRQRIAIARALAVEPSVLILDEPTSALDVSVQQQVLRLLARLQRERNLAYVFISHDLDVVAAMSHRIMVMQRGVVVEEGETQAVMAAPVHPYARLLLSAR